MRIDHDQIFKRLIQAFFREFIELFLPQIAQRIDFSRVEFLEKEQFTDMPVGKRRLLDLVVRVGLLDGGEELLLIHCEFESGKNREEFPFRFCLYHCQLLLRYRLPIIPIAVFTDDAKWRLRVPDSYEIAFEGKTYLKFEYHLLKLKDFDARNFMRQNNPLAVALAAKMNYDKREYIRLKADFLRLILGASLDGARENLLVEFIETYMPLQGEQKEQFGDLVRAEPTLTGVAQAMNLWKIEAKKEGKLEGKLNALLLVLRDRFGALPTELENRLSEIQDEVVLDSLLVRAIHVDTLDEFKV
jgi:hypothetical protein